jgi:hypothetical protein
MIVDKVNACLNAEGQTINEALIKEVGDMASYAFMRQFGEREDKPKTIRLSSIGRCLRQQAYNLLGFEQTGKQIDARAKMVFFMGDLTELAVVALAKAAGCQITACGKEQKTVEIDGVLGHPDGLIDNKTLLEIKSMSSYSFDEFQQSKIDEGYRYQCNAYMEALTLDETCIVGLNKDAGVLHEIIIHKDPDIVKDIRARITTLKAVSETTLPERPYAPNEDGFYPWQCRYCGFYKTCLPTAQLVLKRNAYKLYEPKTTPKGETTPCPTPQPK